MDPLLAPALAAKATEIVAKNRAAGRRVAVAESCTGGLVSAAITEVPGSSAMFEAGYVTYANSAKMAALGVSEEVLDTFGAVSVATAWAMAKGALERSGADVAVAITGIAGPDGGSATKPVGTVVFARVVKGGDPEMVMADTKLFDAAGGRAGIRLEAALCALELLEP
jgi:nicotinamide-nucleotide amidase